ncbi:MAG: enoyl-CoA hydratase/isomerase family protein [Deltaproteobacteria bacterium]|nr:enoyl-CoA hydratase/isomerase family protein [Deltaproteobacteria bacterium]MBW2202772.1 enoyl-CoA hydratase/isomerase family protein [Deltaproteobacteria bacterium]
MSEDLVLIKKEEKTCTVVMNRPRIMNALNGEMVEELGRAFDQIARDDEIRAVIFEGAGDNFSSGADVSLFTDNLSAPEWLDGMKSFGQLVRLMREMPQPLIAKVRGAAVGGGFSLAMAGDFVLASQEARFCLNFVHIGAVLDGGATYFLPRLVGLVKAREIALLGEFINGKKAESFGLIYKSVPDEELDQEVNTLAGALVAKPPVSLSLIKQSLESSLDKSLKDVLEWEAAHQSVMLQSTEHKEMVDLFLKSRGK